MIDFMLFLSLLLSGTRESVCSSDRLQQSLVLACCVENAVKLASTSTQNPVHGLCRSQHCMNNMMFALVHNEGVHLFIRKPEFTQPSLHATLHQWAGAGLDWLSLCLK